MKIKYFIWKGKKKVTLPFYTSPCYFGILLFSIVSIIANCKFAENLNVENKNLVLEFQKIDGFYDNYVFVGKSDKLGKIIRIGNI